MRKNVDPISPVTRASISWNFPVVFATRIAKFLRVSLSKRITHKRYPAYILLHFDRSP